MPRPRIAERRERILDAAESLILDRGFTSMTMSDLAERVGIGKGALYLEFSSKNEIVDHLLARSMRRVLTAADRLLEPGHTLGDLYRVAAESLLDDKLLTAAYLDDEGVLGDYVDSRGADDRYRRRLDAFSGFVELLHRRGELDPSIDPEALALALASFTVGLLSIAKVVGPIPREQLGDAITTVGTIVDRGVTWTAPDAQAPADDERSSAYRSLLDQVLSENARMPHDESTEQEGTR